jgi:hypothetical protein
MEKKTGNFPLNIRNRRTHPLSVLQFYIMLKVFASAIRQEKEIKCTQIGKE